MNRRTFLRQSVLAGGSFLILDDRASVGGTEANSKLNIGLVGVGGRGDWFVGAIPRLGENLVAFCDVDDTKNPSAYQRFPQVQRFHDYRRMLDEMDDELDAVVVAAPDHIHGPASVRALQMGKHVYCEKPLTNSVYESRRVREVARETGLATQMGNQGSASEGYRRAVELIQAGVLGEVREVHAWNNQGGPGRRPRPLGSPSIPDFLKWDLWLGPREERPYDRAWLNWHGWREFGTGNLGNWAPHMLNLPFRALRLDTLWSGERPQSAQQSANKMVRVRADVSEVDDASLPKWEMVHFEFPSVDSGPGAQVHWYNGGAGGFRSHLEDRLGRKLDWGDAGARQWVDWAGVLVLGSQGLLHANAHNTEFTLMPAQLADRPHPSPTLPRSAGHEREWIEACKGGAAAFSHFGYASALTELCLLGNVATRYPEDLVFDPHECRIRNHSAAGAALRRPHREGWPV